jgi:hypothetical protein
MTTAEIRDTALVMSNKDGEAAPTAIEETSGTLGHVAHALDPGASVPAITDPRTGQPWGDSAVYVVTMRGHFAAYGPAPRKVRRPKGTVLSITIDAKSGFVVTQTLGNVVPNLHQVNPSVTRLEG